MCARQWKCQIVTGVVGGVLAFAGAPFAAGASWTVKGTMKVRHQLTKLVDRYYLDRGVVHGSTVGGASTNPASPLVGVEVKVQAKARVLGGWAPYWSDWGTDVTNDAGYFSETETAGSPRKVRVQVRFHSDDLIIRDANGLSDAAKWYTVYEAERSSGTIDLGELVFESTGAEDLDDSDAREQADFWVLARLLMKTMDDLGYPYQGRVEIEQSWHNPGGSDASYCSPIDGVVHINENDFSTYTVIHECMHRWLYDHMSGELGLADEALFKQNQTHCSQDDGESWISFVEGFSEFCEDKLGEIMFGDDPKLPFNHSWLHDPDWEGCNDVMGGDVTCCLDALQCHCAGWVALFRLVTTPDVCLYDFNGDDTQVDRINSSGTDLLYTYADPDIDFEGLLRAITNGSATGQIDKDDMNFADFLERVAEQNLDGELVTAATPDAWLSLLEPSLYPATQPTEVFDRITIERARDSVSPR